MKNKGALFNAATMAIAIAVSFLIAFVIVLFVSEQPGDVMEALLLGPVSSVRNFGNVIELMTTFMFTGLAISIMFQAGQFNVGAEGAFFIGALAAAGAATALNLGAVVQPIVSVAIGAGAGALVTFIPGILKAKLNASELVSSLMMNYAVLFLGLFVLNYFLRDPKFGMLATNAIDESAKLPNILGGTRINGGLIIALGLLVFMYFYIYRTRSGYELRLVGSNEKFAKYTGVNVPKIIILSQVFGGAVAGIGGASEMLGMYDRFQWTSLPGYGWDGVIIAILAYNKPQNIPLAAFFLAYLRIGSDIMARSTDVPKELIVIIQAVIMLLITAKALLGNLKHKMVVKEVVSGGNNI